MRMINQNHETLKVLVRKPSRLGCLRDPLMVLSEAAIAVIKAVLCLKPHFWAVRQVFNNLSSNVMDVWRCWDILGGSSTRLGVQHLLRLAFMKLCKPGFTPSLVPELRGRRCRRSQV